MLALERKATLHGTNNQNNVKVKTQPFGGAIRILDIEALQNLIDDFHFDSERSQAEGDFRIFVDPEKWKVLRDFCVEHLKQPSDPVLETDPNRELVEEFYDTSGICLSPDQYTCEPVATVLENTPAKTDNIHARGHPTVRVYRVFEVIITDEDLTYILLDNSENVSNRDLRKLALADANKGGKGRANAILAIRLKPLLEFYRSLPLQKRDTPIIYKNHRLEETVPVILDELNVPKYQKIP